jgi:hypothetical protein
MEVNMPRLLYDKDSTSRHLDITRRHIRLCQQISSAEQYIASIHPVIQELAAKQAVTNEKIELRQNTLDDLVLNDADLDNSVKTAFEKCKQYDRDHPAERITARMFPGEKFSHITNAPRLEEPNLVEQIAIRFESLSSDHLLAGIAADLREKIDASRSKITLYQDAIRAHKMAEADEEIAQLNVRRQYEANYLNARKDLGRVLAERLFPQRSMNAAPEEPADA